MTTRNRLNDILRKVVSGRGYREALVDHLIANGVTVQEWIPVEERPKEWRDTNGELINYLINIEGYGVDVGNNFGDAGWLCIGMPCNVTHWMPLPEPPKGVE